MPPHGVRMGLEVALIALLLANLVVTVWSLRLFLALIVLIGGACP